MSYKKLTRNQHFQNPGPKRILALDGGGLRGIVTLAYLKRIEDLLRARHGAGDEFRLSHYFDLVAGTSTGAIIAAGTALGMSVDELTDMYMRLGRDVFQKSMWRQGILRARYSHEKLTEHLRNLFGKDTALGGPELETGLLVVTKRMDTGSPWPLGNNPAGKYYQAGEGATWISNKDYPLWKVVRASTAAPSFFSPESITIHEEEGQKTVKGEFVDGGVSPFNNPTLQAFMYATLKGFRVGWDTGSENLLVISVGTGRGHPGKKPTWIAAEGAMQSLLSLMDDNAALVETLVQWMSVGDTHRVIDRELGNLRDDSVGGEASFTYQRYDLSLTRESVDDLRSGIGDAVLDSLTKMDQPENMALLKELGDLDGAKKVHASHFPGVFDLS